MIKFKKDFLWGAAISAEQSEGKGISNKSKTIWDLHFQKYPEDFYDNVGPDTTSDYFNNFKKDAKLFKKTGSNSVRIGFSWARLFPDGETVDSNAVNHYNNVVDSLIENDIKPIITLFHFDMPLWAYKVGGWKNRDVIKKFNIFALFVFKAFSSKVDYFVTFNEPIVPVWAGYQNDIYLPKIIDNQRAVEEMYGIIYAHALVTESFHKIKSPNSKIGVVVNVNPAYPKDGINYNAKDIEASKNYNILHNYSIIDPMVTGKFPKEIQIMLKKVGVNFHVPKDEMKIIHKVKTDFLGINYYSPKRVQAVTTPGETIESQISKDYIWNDARINIFRGWEIYPKGLYDTIMLIKNRYKNIPFFISENGMGVQDEGRFRNNNGMIQDDYRISFIKEHLEELEKAIKDGANCFGYHTWAIMDNWSWTNAYKNRYGFIEVNIDTQERKLKKSAIWFNDFTKNSSFDKGYKKVDELINLKVRDK